MLFQMGSGNVIVTSMTSANIIIRLDGKSESLEICFRGIHKLTLLYH